MHVVWMEIKVQGYVSFLNRSTLDSSMLIQLDFVREKCMAIITLKDFSCSIR